MKSKIFAIMLAVLMVVSILPTGVFADVAVVEVDQEYFNTNKGSGNFGLQPTTDTVYVLTEDIDAGAVRFLTVTGDNRNVTLDLNGHKITSSYTDNVIRVGRSSGTADTASDINTETFPILTIIGDGEIRSTGSYNTSAVRSYNGILNIGMLGYDYDIKITQDAKVNITNSSIKVDEISFANIYSGTFDGYDRSLQSFGTVTIYGGNFKDSVEVWEYTTGSNNYASKLDVRGGEFEKRLESRTYGDDTKTPEITISGGTFKVNEIWTAADGANKTDVSEYVANNTKFVRVADLGKATKRGHDFIGWSVDGVNILDPDQYVAGNVVAVFEANELGNTELLPRLYPLTVKANEGGTVEGFTGKKDLMIAFGAGRKIDIVPEEGYEIKNVVVNGKYNLGAVDSYQIVSAHMAYTVEVEFAEKIVDVITPVYTETFDAETKWVSGGTADAAVLADGKLTVKSTGGDPNINMPEAFGLDCAKIDEIVVKYTNNTENTSFQIFFTNEANPGYSEAGSFKADCVAGENTVVIKTEGNALWTGTLANMRIDLSNGEGEFVVDEITFQTVETMTAKEAAALVKAAE